jgi:DNA polymerase-4
LPPDLRTVPKSVAVLNRLLQKAAMRLRAIDHYAGAIGIHLDYFDDQSWGDDLRLTESQDTLELTVALNRLLEKRPALFKRKAPFRVGVVLTNLKPSACHTPDLFNHERDEERRSLQGAMDTLNQTFGHGSVYFGAAHGCTKAAPMRIAFTAIPKPEVEEIDTSRAGRLRLAAPPPPPIDESVQEFPDYSCPDFSHN